MEKVAMLIVLLPLLAFAQTQNQCIPKCAPGDIAPINGGRPCLCTVNATIPGCTVKACEPGEDSTGAYTCQCTPENHQSQCITLRCTNGTDAHASVATFQSSAQSAKPSCNNLCNCGVHPADCAEDSEHPYPNGPACSCNSNFWPTGCTLKPCQKGDSGANDYFCECTDEYSPEFCLRSQCKNLLI